MDDQTYFWKALRAKNEQEVLALGDCEHRPSSRTANSENSSDMPRESRSNTVDKLTLCMVDSCLFSSSMISSANAWNLLRKHLQAHYSPPHQLPVTIHANFIRWKDKKFEALKQYGLFIYDDKHQRCDEHWAFPIWVNHTLFAT